jgi:integrase
MQLFSVFLRGNRPYYYVSFKNEETGNYLPAVSTKKTKEAEAIRQAWIWYREGIPHKGGTLNIKSRSLRDFIKRSDVSIDDAEFIIDDLKRRGIIMSCIFTNEAGAVRFADFLDEFWDWDRSKYVNEKLRVEHSIHRNYVFQMHNAVNKYWIPFFPSVLLGALVSNDIETFINHLSLILFRGKPLSNSRKNEIIKAGIVPIRWAYRKGIINNDITRSIYLFSDKSVERLILTPQLAKTIFLQDWHDVRCKIANMTAMVTGLRAGELQGLLTGDIGDDCLIVRHSWNRWDKLKTTKTNSERKVELPFQFVLEALKNIAELNPHGYNKDSYVFWSSLTTNKPMEQTLFLKGLRDSLVSSGVSEDESKKISFHGWRHFFTTYMRPKLDDKLLQSQTGHKTIDMLEHYADHLRSGDRDKIRDAQIKVFSALLPSG